ncbi:MAG: hypothetical protein ACYDGR_15035 [Candidatus Dormibacteria bacterium]
MTRSMSLARRWTCIAAAVTMPLVGLVSSPTSVAACAPLHVDNQSGAGHYAAQSADYLSIKSYDLSNSAGAALVTINLAAAPQPAPGSTHTSYIAMWDSGSTTYFAAVVLRQLTSSLTAPAVQYETGTYDPLGHTYKVSKETVSGTMAGNVVSISYRTGRRRRQGWRSPRLAPMLTLASTSPATRSRSTSAATMPPRAAPRALRRVLAACHSARPNER